MEACTMQLDSLADENLVQAMAGLPAGSVIALATASKRFSAPARADVLWLPLSSQRWHFGAVPTAKESLLPGARDLAAESALAEAAQTPLQSRACAWDFFARRCRQDADVAQWTLQFNEAFLHPDPVPPRGFEELMPGTLARVVNLANSPKYNGAVGVVGTVVNPNDSERRFAVTLVGQTKPISVRGPNLAYMEPRKTEEEAKRLILEAGASGIDTLARMARNAEAFPALSLSVRHVLALATQLWSEHQWRLLLADPGRTDLLEEGGLIVSQWAAPDEADVAQVRARLAQLAGAVESRTSSTAPIMERVEAVNAVLFDDWGLKGNVEEYYDPRNSFLHEVLSRRCGIPISLSIVWAAVARRVKVPCFLLANMPAHVLIRVTMTDAGLIQDDIFVDAYSRKIMDYDAFRRFAIGVVGTFDVQFAVQCPATSVYARLLRNLQNIYKDKCQQRDITDVQRIDALQCLDAVCAQLLAPSPENSSDAQVLTTRSLKDQVLKNLDTMRSHRRKVLTSRP